jgi:hypothetical protein
VFWALLTFSILVGLFGLDRLFLWMEMQGWVYYRRSKSESGALSGAVFGALQEIFEPAAVEIRQEKEREEEKQNEDEAGADPPA